MQFLCGTNYLGELEKLRAPAAEHQDFPEKAGYGAY
jgi:hypothetical protein